MRQFHVFHDTFIPWHFPQSSTINLFVIHQYFQFDDDDDDNIQLIIKNRCRQGTYSIYRVKPKIAYTDAKWKSMGVS